MNSGLLFGVFFILFGLSILINVIFGINIPIFKGILALFLIYLGISMLTGGFKGKSTFYCSRKSYTYNANGNSYDTVFNEQVIDLRKFTAANNDDAPKTINLNTVFGRTILKLDPNVPTKLMINTVFGVTKLPDGSSATFGDVIYETDENIEPKLIIKGTVVFGNLEIVND